MRSKRCGSDQGAIALKWFVRRRRHQPVEIRTVEDFKKTDVS
jgi:hypothetical protein